MILIELTAAIDAAGTLRTFYVSDGRFTTSPTGTPANISFDPSVLDPGSIGLHAFGDGRTGGSTKLETGEIVLANINGQYDDWLNYSFEGRPVVIRSGTDGAYPGAFPVLMRGTASGMDATSGQIVIKLKDKQLLFDKPLLTATYGGTNVLPNGLDGLATDLKGKVRPRALGRVLNVTPPQANTSRLIFEVGVCASVDAVYSSGAALTAGANYTSQADMEANAPASGFFRAWPAGGYFRIGSYSGEQITCDVTEGAAASDRTVAQILRRIVAMAGIPDSEISGSDVVALDELSAHQVGIWIDDSTTITAALDQIATSIGAWYGFDQTGVLRMGQLTAPAGAPVLSLYDYSILTVPDRRAPTDNGVPIWRATVNHTKCYTVQTSGLAGSAAARAGFVGKERRSVQDADETIKRQWMLAGELSVDTLLVSDAAATSEAARLGVLYRARRDIFDVQVDIGLLAETPVRIMDVVGITYRRYGMSAGRSFRLIGISFDLVAKVATLSLWG